MSASAFASSTVASPLRRAALRAWAGPVSLAGLALAAAAQWIANWLVTLTFPGLSRMGLGLAYGLYAAAAALSFVFVLRLVRETKGRALEEM